MTLFHDRIYAEAYMDYPKHPAATRPAEPNLVAIQFDGEAPSLAPVAMRAVGLHRMEVGSLQLGALLCRM
jgi:hypothetical protein